MFNGIIYSNGIVSNIIKYKNSFEIFLKTNIKFTKSEIGSSVSCNGACLTITSIKNKFISFYLSRETLNKTNFNIAPIGSLINLEKSLAYGTKISGHYIQGHIDTTGVVSEIFIQDKTWLIKFIVPLKFKKYLIEKGSISINGVSLTISKVFKNKFEISIIPHTLKLTNLSKLKKKNIVNIEFDMFSKYILKLKN